MKTTLRLASLQGSLPRCDCLGKKYIYGDYDPSSQTESLRHDDSVHPLLGLSKHLFFTMQKIRQVKPMEQPDELSSPVDFKLFLDLEQELSTLQFDLCPPSENASARLDIGTQMNLVTLAETYRFSALILLYRRSAMRTHQLPILARHIISLVERIPPGNAAEAGLTYPLFLAGAELTSEDEIIKCATRLISIRKRFRVMNIQSAETVLEEVWRARLNGEVPKDWERILRERQWVINLG
jgi:transcriptional activator protein UGA3